METKIQYKLSWNEYGELIEDLWNNLKPKISDLKIDAIIPILREGAFTAIPLAYKLNTYKIIPIQFKYMLFNGGNELKQIAQIPQVNFSISDDPIFLLCDTFPCGGNTKLLAIQEFKKIYTKARFVFVSIIQDLTISQNMDILSHAYAVSVNEDWETDHPIFTKAQVKNVLNVLLPWENAGEELAGPNMTEWNYN